MVTKFWTILSEAKKSNPQKKFGKIRLEQNHEFVIPEQVQTKIDPKKHSDLIDANFLASRQKLSERGLTFSTSDVESYEQMIRHFKPSTLLLEMPDCQEFYDVWLDPTVIEIVSLYMGFYPELIEAYVRRNFPCEYQVMNHYWHRDTNHHKHLLKAFIFLSDCDLETGAQYYIAGSIEDPRFKDKTYYTIRSSLCLARRIVIL